MRPLKIALLSVVFLSNFAFAQLDTVWTSTIYYNTYLQLESVTSLANGDIAVAGISFSGAPNYQDIVVARFTGSGEMLWIHSYGGEGVQDAWSILEADNGNLLVFGAQIPADDSASALIVMGIDPSGDSLWASYIEGPTVYYDYGAARLSDGNFAVVCDIQAAMSDEQDIYLLKFNAQGDTIWTRTFDIYDYETGRKITELPDGSLLLAGTAADVHLFQEDLLLVKTTADGSLDWSARYPNEEYNGYDVRGLSVNSSGEIFVSGTMVTWMWWGCAFAKKLTPTGDVIWEVDTSSVGGSEYNAILPEIGGGCTAIGQVLPDFGLPFLIIDKFDAGGELTESWMSSDYGGFLNACPVASGGAAACGYRTDFDGNTYGYLMRLGPPSVLTGTVREIGSDEPVPEVRVYLVDMGVYDVTDANGEYEIRAIADTTDVELTGPCITPQTVEEVILEQGQINVRDFSVGIPVYDRQPSSINTTVIYNDPDTTAITIYNTGTGDLSYTVETEVDLPEYNWLFAEPAGGVLAPGESQELSVIVWADSEQGYDPEFFGWVVVRNHSCPDSVDRTPVFAVTLDAGEPVPGAITEYALHPAYPNPFNPATSITFDLPQGGAVDLRVFDVLGRQAALLAEGPYAAGRHTVSFNGADLPSGVYFYTLCSGPFTESRKMVLLK